MNITTIKFEDHGQDFLEWDIDPDGNIIDCRPFQGSVWCKCRVQNDPEEIEVGDAIDIHSPFSGDLTMNYPVVKVTRKEAA